MNEFKIVWSGEYRKLINKSKQRRETKKREILRIFFEGLSRMEVEVEKELFLSCLQEKLCTFKIFTGEE